MFVQTDEQRLRLSVSQKIWLALGVVFCVTLATTLLLYGYTHTTIKLRLYDRIGSLAQTTALHVHELPITPDLAPNSALELYLRAVVRANPMLSRVYIVKPMADQSLRYYGVSAHESQTSFYDTIDQRSFSSEQQTLLNSFVVSTFSIVDAIDSSVTAYAPVITPNGQRVTIALEVDQDEYFTYTHAVLYPFVLFVLGLLAIITLLTWLLLKTSRQQLSTMQETDRQKDELLSIVSHQLATPVSSMQYILELLQDGDYGKLSKKQTEQITKLQSLVHSSSDLVRMILDVSRIQMGKMSVHPTTFNLENFVDGVLDMVQPKITEKHLKFVTTITRPMPDITADERLLRMTVLNVVSNAIKYTEPKGTIWFEASVEREYFYCKITDTGVGIPEEEQGKLYQKLYRASNVRDQENGTGFGLYVAKGAIEAQGGSIQFHSKVGKGTTFYIQLPLSSVAL